MKRLFAGMLALTIWMAGCGDDGEGGEGAAGLRNPFQEVVDLGITRYFGAARPVSSSQPEPGVVSYEFDPADGPVCMTGTPYRMSVRDRGSADLFIFLQGGGACWSDFCLAITSAPAGIPPLDVLDPAKPTNPLRDLSTVYLPYCDGSLFSGDREHDDDGDGDIDRIHHGLANLSAALDLAREHFPNPRRIVLAGSSGGSYGTVIATLLVRSKWLGVEILVFQDSGPGIARADDPSFVMQLADEFGFDDFIPASCADCLANGHTTRFIEWGLERDPQIRVAVFSSYEDFIISEVFLKIGGPAYRAALEAESARLHSRFPDRYRRFLVDGNVHTTLLGDARGIVGSDLGAIIIPPDLIPQLTNVQLGTIDGTHIGNLTIAAWVQAFVDQSPAWVDITK